MLNKLFQTFLIVLFLAFSEEALSITSESYASSEVETEFQRFTRRIEYGRIVFLPKACSPFPVPCHLIEVGITHDLTFFNVQKPPFTLPLYITNRNLLL